LTPFFKKVMNQNGVLILSGIINTREYDVTNALHTEGFIIAKSIVKNSWVCIIASIDPLQ